MSIGARTDARVSGATRTGGTNLTGAGGVVLVVVLAAAGGAYDLIFGSDLAIGFAIGLTAGAGIAALLVRRPGRWAVVIAPPLVYIVLSFLATFAAPDGVVDTPTQVGAALVGWLVYGFPGMASATGLAGLIALIRNAGKP